MRESARPVDEESKAFEKMHTDMYKRDMDDLLTAKHIEMKKKGITVPTGKAEEDKDMMDKMEESADAAVAAENAKKAETAAPLEDPYSVYKAREIGFREPEPPITDES